MDTSHADLEKIWDELLSGDPDQVRLAFNSLDAESQKEVIKHLQRMASEAGWQPEQRQSAQAALNALENQSNQG